MAGGTWTDPTGQDEYLTDGTYSWTCPAGIYSVSVVTVGAGAKGGNGNNGYPGGSGGGALRYKNNISVSPGTSYTVVVGDGTADNNNYNDKTSYFNSTGTVSAKGGYQNTASYGSNGSGGTQGTGTGGNGGNGGPGYEWFYAGSGGGAGGYSGTGGVGGRNYGAVDGGDGSGGAGGGGCMGGGGGVGLKGAGTSGDGGLGYSASNDTYWKRCGQGGSDGLNGGKQPLQVQRGGGGSYSGTPTHSYQTFDECGGECGGGSNGPNNSRGSDGGVRIIYPGNVRQFPSTRTADENV